MHVLPPASPQTGGSGGFSSLAVVEADHSEPGVDAA